MKTLERSAVPVLAVIGCCLAALLGFARPAYALADAAGNEFLAGDAAPAHVERDLYWAGGYLDLGGAAIGGDLLAVGQSVDVNELDVAGSVRAAAQRVSLTNAQVAGNVTAAGQKVVFGEGSTAAAVYAAAQKVEFAGEATTASLVGQTVRIDGKVDGDLTVDAQTIVLGPNAQITGTLHADVSKEPQVDASAKVGKLDITVTSDDDSEEEAPTPEALARKAAFSAAGAAVVALLISLLFPRATRGAAAMLENRKLPLFVSGSLGVVLSIPAALLLCVAVLPLGLGVSGLLALAGVAVLGVPFSAAVAGRALAPKWPRVASAALVGAILGALYSLPYLGVILGVLCGIFTLGYLLQLMWLGIKAEREEREDRASLPAAHAK